MMLAFSYSSCAVRPFEVSEGGTDSIQSPEESIQSGGPAFQSYEVSIVIAAGRFVKHLTPRGGAILGTAPSQGRAEEAITHLRAALSKYSAAFLRRTQLKRVILCAELSMSGSLCVGLNDKQEGAIYLEVEEAEDLARTMHHELFHLVDPGKWWEGDPVWEAANPVGFTYGPEGLPPPDVAPVGFVTPYATSMLGEDKAETFAAIMEMECQVFERLLCDPILRKKVLLVRKILEEQLPGVPLPTPVLQITATSTIGD